MMQDRFTFSACTAKRGVGTKQRNTRPQTAIGSREPLGCPKETAFLMGRCFVRLANGRVQRFFLGQHTRFPLEPDGGGKTGLPAVRNAVPFLAFVPTAAQENDRELSVLTVDRKEPCGSERPGAESSYPATDVCRGYSAICWRGLVIYGK